MTETTPGADETPTWAWTLMRALSTGRYFPMTGVVMPLRVLGTTALTRTPR